MNTEELIERLEGLTGPSADASVEVALALGAKETTFDVGDGDPSIYWQWPDGTKAAHYTSSLDAALELTGQLAPDLRVENLCEWDHGPWTCDLVERGKDGLSAARKGKCSHAPTPAIALLIALLRALKEGE